MSKFVLHGLGALGFSLLMSGAHADALGGCVNSPENPTAVLGLIGLVAAGVPWVKGQITQRRRSRKHEDDAA